MTPARRWIGMLLCACGALAGAHPLLANASETAQLDRLFPRSTLQIATPNARLHKFNVWLADDTERRTRGLMFVKHLADDEGMLFVFEQPQPISMWMKNTYISLDMLFVAADGKIVRVAANTEPMSLKTIESGGPALAVIELKAGSAARLHITKGARVTHPAFGSKP